MKKVPISTITPGMTIWYECYSERGELLLTPGTIVTQHLIDQLVKRNIFEVYLLTPGTEQMPTEISGASRQRSEAQKPQGPSVSDSKPASLPVKILASPAEIAEDFNRLRIEQLPVLLRNPVARHLDLSVRRGRQLDRPVGVAMQGFIRPVSPAQRSTGSKDEAIRIYQETLDTVKDFLRTILRGKSVDIAPVRKAADQLLRLFMEDSDILLNLAGSKSQSEDYLYRHMLNTCILAMSIATASGYNREQVTTIAMGALLHDIGMPLVPKEIRDKTSKLSSGEFAEIQKHPVMGILILEKIRHLPDPVSFMLYQSHERENGSGYPQKRMGKLIHRYAKIIQIADVYEALTSPRKHRTAFSSFEAMEMTIRMGQRGLLAPHYVKSFLFFTSLFPIGSTVELSDHRLARVIHANPAAFHRPVVSVIRSEKNTMLTDNEIYQIDLAYDERISVIRVLAPDETPDIELMRGF